ncbi:hypothetical protein Tco_0126393, partial [Tanacetum coccineum]
MGPLALRQTRRPRNDPGKARRSVSSSSSHHQDASSHQHDDVETSRASTASPNTYLNSLHPLNYQNYYMPSSFEQTDGTLFARQTTLLNQTQRMHEEMREGFKSFGKALKGVFSKKKKHGRSKSRGPSNRGNHCSSSSKGKFADVECYHCHKKGHTMKFCRQLKKENKKKNDDDGDDSTEVNTTTDEFFVCSDYDMV